MAIEEGDTSSSGAVLNVGPFIGPAVDFLGGLFKSKPGQPFDPLGVAKKTLKNQQELFALQQVINAQIAAGGRITLEQSQQQKTLLDQKERLERKFAKQQAKKPQKFIQAGIAAGTTLLELVQQLSFSPAGRRIIAQSASTLFAPPPLESITGGTKVPFTVTPSFQSSSGPLDFGGFGGIIESVIKAGGQIGSALLAPKQPQFQQAAFGLVPQIGGALGRAILPTLPQIGGGIVGGELADAFQNLFSGGASTQDDTAAFTDPIPGSCRPKAHVKVNPCTGKGTWFTPRGRPLVFSGDMAACKRVARVSKRLNKALPLRKHGHTVRSRKR